ncbi:ArsR family transcriptional regulator [Streptomyces sp. NPDC001985]|uniref:ArsR/SmtB family transcription factor n=1 Tax=Streptomyces sp. NPDC001985 TaxID=3154406 RepID=UPI00332438D4
METSDLTGDSLVKVLAALASPHRTRVLAALATGPTYVSQLARDLGISRALLQVHLKRLQAAGLVSDRIEVSDDGKAMKFYEVVPFALCLTPRTLATASESLTGNADRGETAEKEN